MFKLLVCLFIITLSVDYSLGFFKCGLGEVYKGECPAYCEDICRYGKYKDRPACSNEMKPCGKSCKCALGFIRDLDTGSCLPLTSCWFKIATHPVPRPTVSV